MSSLKNEDNSKSNETEPKIKKETILIVILCALLFIALILPSNNGLVNLFKTSNDNDTQVENSYANQVEKNLEKLLSEISGVGKVAVKVSVNGSEKQILAKNVLTTQENGVIKVSETIVTVSGKPYVISTENPEVKSVIIVCNGADDLSIKMKITEVVSSYLNVSVNDIKIYKRK